MNRISLNFYLEFILVSYAKVARFSEKDKFGVK